MAQIDLSDHGAHPLAVRFHDLARELRRLPDTPGLTVLLSQFDELRRAAERQLAADAEARTAGRAFSATPGRGSPER